MEGRSWNWGLEDLGLKRVRVAVGVRPMKGWRDLELRLGWG